MKKTYGHIAVSRIILERKVLRQTLSKTNTKKGLDCYWSMRPIKRFGPFLQLKVDLF